MAAVDVGVRDVPPINDDLDELFNYDVDNDLLRETDTNMDVAPKQSTTSREKDGILDGLGLDEEIKVTKKRAPIAKLDENRLLSQVGIPKLRKIAKERLRFKGKGHEYSDIVRLLNFYQLWLDDLYPRAKFADGLAMIEKLGHSKRIQTMRKEWINEGKAKHSRLVDDQDTAARTPSNEHKPAPTKERRQSSESHNAEQQSFGPGADLEDGDREGPREKDRPADDTLFISDGESAPMDDLDALLAEDNAFERTTTSAASPKANESSDTRGDNFDDEEEAMAGMDDIW